MEILTLQGLLMAKLFSFRTHIKYMFGVRVPKNHMEALELDAENGDARWADSELRAPLINRH